MLIATFNANSIRTRLPIILDWIREQQPDILCIQETKVQDHQFPFQVFEQEGLHVAFRGEKSYNGVAIVSREPPDAVAFGLDDDASPDETRFCHATFGEIQIVNTYVPQGREIEHPMYQYKLEWFRRLRRWFDHHTTPQTPLVWLGDLNVAPDMADIHNAEKQTHHVCFHVDVRNAFAETCNWGFTDVFRHFHPEAGQFTFFDYRTPNAVKRGMGWRIDHILATKPLAACATDAGIDLAPRLLPKPSDHTFLYARFDTTQWKT